MHELLIPIATTHTVDIPYEPAIPKIHLTSKATVTKQKKILKITTAKAESHLTISRNQNGIYLSNSYQSLLNNYLIDMLWGNYTACQIRTCFQ